MAGGDSGQKIIRTYFDMGAPTGEGRRYVTSDGTHWKDDPGAQYRRDDYVTGRRTGVIVGDRIETNP